MNNNKHFCLDANGNLDGTVGFWGCNNGPNQNFKFDTNNNVFRLHDNDFGDACLTYMDGSIVQVWVYTNGDGVELFLNNQSMGFTKIPMFEKATYAVSFQPGNLTAIATKKGQPWATDTIITAYIPAAIKLTMEPRSTMVVADGQDVAMFTAKITDQKGNIIHDKEPLITFNVSGAGRLVGVGNGNPSDHTSDKSNSRHVFNGMVRAIVQATNVSGTIKVTAISPKIQSDSISFMTVPPTRRIKTV